MFQGLSDSPFCQRHPHVIASKIRFTPATARGGAGGRKLSMRLGELLDCTRWTESNRSVILPMSPMTPTFLSHVLSESSKRPESAIRIGNSLNGISQGLRGRGWTARTPETTMSRLRPRPFYAAPLRSCSSAGRSARDHRERHAPSARHRCCRWFRRALGTPGHRSGMRSRSP